ncbi:SPOR domain-containing protein [Undibacterium umbellatum]|uniref:SPOR domain-containing protein n=1 Tax=Undibacterium umbellatum TaxID=2762300 RepID=A0ABR6ZGJ5_9BURK|nr:SPOR domain-containing protein [Undibacterium umbellatum]MBC3910471.1 SPOR domain-containing protein [Undibacterium umbellatum]
MKAQQNAPKQKNGQRGSTLTGIIIGLVIGLAIAVGVAMVITKTSTPFTNKNGKSDKADIPLTQLQDPNKPLYGNKDAVKEANKELTASKPAETVAPPPPKPVEAKPPEKTAAEKAAEKAEKAAEAAKHDNADEKYIYFLQVGAFKEQAAAENSRAKLALIGFEARILEKTSDSGTMYHVRLGPYSQLEAMNRTRSRLSENSVDVAVVRTVK